MSKAIPKYIIAFLTLTAHTALAQSTSCAVTVSTTSGQLIGLVQDGVQAFKGIRFAEAPVGNLRWAPPQPFLSTEVQNATSFGASCIPQYSSQTEEDLFNNGGPTTSDEDCLLLNVWTSTKNSGTPKPVLFWIYGGSLAFGSSALPTYDGTIFAKNQDVVVVSLNYRLNIFGFPLSPDLPPEDNNLGLLDQDLALQWVQKNIAQFGGDPERVTIMGQSAGGRSVSSAFLRYTSDTAPFRAGIMLSGSSTYNTPLTNHTPFDAFAQAVNCTQKPGPARLDCLRAVPADVIANLTNADPNTFNFDLTIDNVTSFANPLERIAANQTALEPILLGNMEGDGTIWTLGFKTLREALVSYMGEFTDAVTDDEIRALYPGQNDSVVMPNFIRDWQYRCAAGLWAKAFVENGESNVFRYTYGATFPNLEPIPTLGAWHGSELPEIFGTFPSANATTDEATLSATFQTTIANFVKDPTTPPAKHWLPYVPSNSTNALAKLAYNGNVQPDNFVVAVPSESLDGPCEVLYNRFLNFTM